jgi:hypothetical protein
MNNPLTDVLNAPLSDPLEEISLRMAVAATDIAELRAEIRRLDRELDEARRLNARAAQLLDLVSERLGAAPLVLAPDALPGQTLTGALASGPAA